MDKELDWTDYERLVKIVTSEITQVVSLVVPVEVEKLTEEILKAKKVFFFAVGRVFLALQCLAKRLAHLDIDVQVVGSVTEKPITAKDLLIIASGSGESKLAIEISRIAGSHGAKLGLITSAQESTIKSMADFAVHLPCPTKTDQKQGVESIQSMSTLFDQSLHIFGDVLCMILQQKKGLRNEDLWKRHANLE